MNEKEERLMEALRMADVDSRDRADIYNVCKFSGLESAVMAASSLFSYQGKYAPEIEDLDDDEFLDEY